MPAPSFVLYRPEPCSVLDPHFLPHVETLLALDSKSHLESCHVPPQGFVSWGCCDKRPPTQPWRPEIQNQGVGRAALPLEALGGEAPAIASCGVPDSLCLAVSSLHLCLLLYMASSPVSVCPLLLREYESLDLLKKNNNNNNLTYLFIFGCAGSLLLCWFFCSCGEQGLLSSRIAQASHCGGFFCHRAWALGCTGFHRCSSTALECRLNSCGARD